MKSKKLQVSILAIVLLFAVIVLSRPSVAPEDTGPVYKETVDGDLKLSLQSVKNIYSAMERPQLTARIEYIGEKESIELYHPLPLCSISLLKNGEYLDQEKGIMDVQICTPISRGEVIEVQSNCKNDLKHTGWFSRKGEYTAEAVFRFSTGRDGQEQTKRISINISIE